MYALNNNHSTGNDAGFRGQRARQRGEMFTRVHLLFLRLQAGQMAESHGGGQSHLGWTLNKLALQPCRVNNLVASYCLSMGHVRRWHVRVPSPPWVSLHMGTEEDEYSLVSITTSFQFLLSPSWWVSLLLK